MRHYMIISLFLIGCGDIDTTVEFNPYVVQHDHLLAHMTITRVNECVVAGGSEAACLGPAMPVLQSWCALNIVPEGYGKACDILAAFPEYPVNQQASYAQHDLDLAHIAKYQYVRCLDAGEPMESCMPVELDVLESWCDLGFVPLEDADACSMLESILSE